MVTCEFPDHPSGFCVDHQQREIIQRQRQHPAESNKTHPSSIHPKGGVRVRSHVSSRRHLSRCSFILAGAAFSFSCSSCFLVLKHQNLSSQSEPEVKVSWFKPSMATPRTAPLWAGKKNTLVTTGNTTGSNHTRGKALFTFLVAIATAVQAGLHIVDVNTATRRANDGKVATGSDVNGL